jgi:hypothetical protein
MAGKRSNLLMILAGVIVLLGVVSVIHSLKTRPLESEEFAVKFGIVADGGGFDLNTTALTFGNLNPGGAAVRKISAKNDYPFDVVVKIRVSKNIRDVLVVEREHVLGVGEKKDISFTIAPPQDYELGQYEGTVRVEIYREGD